MNRTGKQAENSPLAFPRMLESLLSKAWQPYIISRLTGFLSTSCIYKPTDYSGQRKDQRTNFYEIYLKTAYPQAEPHTVQIDMIRQGSLGTFTLDIGKIFNEWRRGFQIFKYCSLKAK